MIPISQGGFHGARNEDGRVHIGDNSLGKYIPRHINPTGNRNKITCGCETFISSMLFQSDLNKWWLTQFEKYEKLYTKTASTRILQIS